MPPFRALALPPILLVIAFPSYVGAFVSGPPPALLRRQGTPSAPHLRPSLTSSGFRPPPQAAATALSADLAGLWDGYLQALEAQPLLTKALTASVLIPMGDLSAQLIESTKKKDASLDVARVTRFFIFGLLVQAPWNHFYFQLLDSLLPPPSDPLSPINALKTFIDQGINAPVRPSSSPVTQLDYSKTNA